jgi:mRNA-degrading endonuclease RelE of RelBE toxin-antitoxin system
MQWDVEFTNKAAKQVRKLNKQVEAALRLLVEDLMHTGPAQPSWPNYSKLHQRQGIDRRHCHLIKGKPTYVCCWEVTDSKMKIIEVYYVGTHEGAPY